MPFLFFFFFNDTATTEISTLPLHDALPIWSRIQHPPYRQHDQLEWCLQQCACKIGDCDYHNGQRHNCFYQHQQFHVKHRSEEHTSELQSPCNLVCRLLLEKKDTVRHNLRTV